MNNNDLFNALSGLDPKFIDEAAFELHGAAPKTKEAMISKISEKSKISRIKKVIFVSLPAVAVIFLTLAVTLPFLMRMNTNESASMATSDTAQYEAAEEAAADTAPAYEAEEAAEAYEAEEAAGTYEESVGNAAAEPAAAAGEEAEYGSADGMAADATAGSGTGSSAESSAKSAADSSEAISSAAKDDSVQKSASSLERASFKDGILTVEIRRTLPENAEEMKYSITAAEEGGSKKILAEGKLGDIIRGQDPLTLDISTLKLPEGTYSFNLGSESIDFSVQSSSR